MIIESLQNDRIKNLIRLQTKNNERRNSQTFVVEGIQENIRALKFGFNPIEFYVCEDIFRESLRLPLSQISISPKVYAKIAYRGTTEGIIGVYKEKENLLSDFKPAENSSIILLESIEKPGNLGAVLRSCEAFGIDAVIITDPKVDFYNPNVIRSSVGCFFGMNLFNAQNEEAVNFFQKNSYQVITTFMDGKAKQIQTTNLSGKTAICFGTEHSGLSEFWKGKGENYLIPMAGTIDSLNLSNAVAVTCYEVLRQRIS